MTTTTIGHAPEEIAADAAAAVRVCGLTKMYGTTVGARDVSFEAPRGEIVALLGPSGGGKTTTLRLIAGFETPNAGTVEIGGEVVAGPGRFTPPERRRVGMVFQDYALFPHLTVRQNVGFGLSRSARRERAVDDVLEWLGLAAVAQRMPHQLSGGQQQRVALARAMAPNPGVVLLDEPFSNLDSQLRVRVRNEMRNVFHEAHATAIFVTHDQAEAMALADSVGVMLGNTLVQLGAPQDVYYYPASLEVAEFLGETNVLDGEHRNGRVDCALGNLRVRGNLPANGAVRVSVRPESIRLRPDAGPTVEATVAGVEFRGVYKVARVQLDAGPQVSAVMGLHIEATPGERCPVGVNSFVAAFGPPAP